MQPVPTVAVFSLGGTIAMSRGSGADGVVPALGAQQLLDAIPALSDLQVQLRVHDFLRKPGASLTISDVTALHRAIMAACAAGVDGIVITQGTDTIEETAFLLHLMHDTDAPIVVTGAMRNPTLPGPDGPANLIAAILAAADPAMRMTGCSVAMNDELHTAMHVRKTHTTSTAAFKSPACGPFATVQEGRVRIIWRPRPRKVHEAALTGTEATPRVALLQATLDDDGYLIGHLAEHSEGIVVAAFGAGHVPASWLAPLAELAVVKPVVLTSRIGSGSVLEGTYGFPGSEMSLAEAGLINGGLLAPHQARLALHLMLAAHTPFDRIRRTVYELGRP
jgi:L-asparaginase